MMPLRIALESIGTALAKPSSLSALMAQLERALTNALAPARIGLRLVSETSDEPAGEIPLVLDGELIGGILVHAPHHPRRAEVASTLQLLAPLIAAAIVCRQRPERRGREGPSANIDALCRIANRRAFDEHVLEAWDRAFVARRPLVMAIIDVDYFKIYNDRYGHIAGDRCLQRVASLLVKRRDGDDGFAARYGGEEFVIVFEETGLEHAISDIQHIADRLAALNLEHAGSTLGRVSLSSGLAEVVPTRDCTIVELIEEADRALYQAKRFGRNRICAGSYVSMGPIVAKLRARDRTYAAADVPSFGRDDDLARMLSALRHARVLTLVGPCGIGKSRLLTLVADEVTTRLRRSVVFVEPELLRAGMDPATALASACDLSVDTDRVLDTVTDFLGDRDCVVILDDVEPAGAELRTLCTHLIAHTSGVSIIAAARTPFGFAGERAIVVPPLDDDAALELLSFCGGGADAPSRRIVRLLGGNPASIQLAAEWIGRLGAAQVLDQLVALDGTSIDPAALAALFPAST
jgi:diguanylate cyclase (GGDEF)-like protein